LSAPKSVARRCGNCGETLRRTDQYCSQCGALVGELVGVPILPVSQEQWEYCEITWSARGFLNNDRSFFWAQNLISGAEMVRGVTTFTPDDLTIRLLEPHDDASTRRAVKELVPQLLDDGWEPIKTSGVGWWSQRFSRRIRS
jgi:hypothetical protein